MYDEQESEELALTDELAALQRQLARMELAPLQLNRDQLMFAAGRAAGRAERELAATQRVAGSTGWFWPSAAAMMTAASVALATMLVWREEPLSIAQQTAKPQAAVEHPADSIVESSRLTGDFSPRQWAPRTTSGYLGMRHIALTQGIGAIGSETLSYNGRGNSSVEPRPEAATVRDLLNELLPNAASQPRAPS